MKSWVDYLENEIDPENLKKANEEISKGKNPSKFLLDEKIISQKTLLSAMSSYYNLPYIELDRYHPEEKAISTITEEIARKFSTLPLFTLKERLYIAISDPEKLQTQEFLRQLTGLTIESVIATTEDIESAINRSFLTKEMSAQAMGTFVTEESQLNPQEEIKVIIEEAAPVIKLVNYIFTQAIKLEASDIHIEPFSKTVFLRYRIDGILHEFPPPPLYLLKSLISRIKIISNLDVAEKRLPQDGRTGFILDGKEYDFRVSILPNLHGEGVVIRVLDTQGKKKDLEDLGFSLPMISAYKEMIKKPFGILLVTGPTGSGKTSTLYATLKHIYTPKKKIITLEDPVEYQLEGITQVNVNPDIGFTFAAGLRSILRHDPDIIMLGEIRDLETAEIAIRSSLTGHFVFSTLHTNDAPSAIVRLVDMGIPSYLVFSSLIGILAQRLVRLLCPKCKIQVNLNESELSSLGIAGLPQNTNIFGPVGCSYCNNLGYKGRMAIYELVNISPEIKRLPQEKISPEIIKDIANKQGFVTLRKSAVEKLYSGLTSIEEVLSITSKT